MPTPIPDLPTPPWWAVALFERPLPIIAGAAALAGATLFAGRRAGRMRPAVTIAALLLLLAVGAFLTARTVRTDRESLADAGRDLVRAVAAPDGPALERLLADDARVTMRQLGDAVERPGILAAVRTLHGVAQVRDADVLDTRSGITGPSAGRTYIRVRLDADGLPRDSWWEVSWRRDGTVWRAVSVRPHWIQGVPNP